MVGRSWRNDLRAYETGKYQPVVPTVRCVSAVSAGASPILVDETLGHEPVRVGAYLSYNDWPFMVTGRSGSGASTTLSVTLLRTAIPVGGAISLAASGLFLATSDTMGNPAYDVNRVARFDLDFKEWINR